MKSGGRWLPPPKGLWKRPLRGYWILGPRIVRVPYVVVKRTPERSRSGAEGSRQRVRDSGNLRVSEGADKGVRTGSEREARAHVDVRISAGYEWRRDPSPDEQPAVPEAEDANGDLGTHRGRDTPLGAGLPSVPGIQED